MGQNKIITLFGIISNGCCRILYHEGPIGNSHFDIPLFFKGINTVNDALGKG